ncbi:hypothetical protein UFOVP235_24 [uncultured Caudovirales phage]|uniref:Uncharacterized protein n=1 Tax=uncultured Caudovirales phage TaxID=2100421 RepID=A0A6J7WQG7_9CAUD|nr:hypothetical protein UFOVP235_24 [uncultured Caudovirales phage]
MSSAATEELTATPEEIAIVEESLAKALAKQSEPVAARRQRKPVEAPALPVEFVSKEVEPHEFEVLEISPHRRPDRRLIWVVPHELVNRFEVHHHVQRGRIVRADTNV